jgi:hypothetical protein
MKRPSSSSGQVFLFCSPRCSPRNCLVSLMRCHDMPGQPCRWSCSASFSWSLRSGSAAERWLFGHAPA